MAKKDTRATATITLPKNKCIMSVRYEFSAAELQKLGEDVALSVETLLAQQNDKKEAMKYHASLIEASQNKVTKLSHLRTSRYEMRDMECDIVPHQSEGRVSIMRPDTKEVVEERDMTPAEKQIQLPINEDVKPS